MLRTRLFLNLLPFVVTLLAIGAYAIALLSRLAGNVDVTVTENYRGILTAQAAQLSLAAMEREAWGSTTAAESDSPAYAENRKQFEKALAVLVKTNALAGEEELNDPLATNYLAMKKAMRAFKSTSGSEARLKVYQQEVLPPVLR